MEHFGFKELDMALVSGQSISVNLYLFKMIV